MAPPPPRPRPPARRPRPREDPRCTATARVGWQRPRRTAAEHASRTAAKAARRAAASGNLGMSQRAERHGAVGATPGTPPPRAPDLLQGRPPASEGGRAGGAGARSARRRARAPDPAAAVRGGRARWPGADGRSWPRNLTNPAPPVRPGRSRAGPRLSPPERSAAPRRRRADEPRQREDVPGVTCG